MITFIKRIVFLLLVSAFLAVAGVGCNTARGFGKDVQGASEGIQGTGQRPAERGNNPIADQRIKDSPPAERGYNHITDQHIQDSRTAERVREALAASDDYEYAGVKVTACDGVVQLSGFVNTSAQRSSAAEAAGKVLGAKSVVNTLTVKE
jgi:osmotically-inducible protein OsmY